MSKISDYSQFNLNQKVIVDDQLRESVQYNDPIFPLARFIDQLDNYKDGGFLCHWHSDFEFGIVLQGQVEYQLDKQHFQLSAGEGIFINSQVMHSAHQLQPGTVVFNTGFSPLLFSSPDAPSLYSKYVKSICSSKYVGSIITDATKEGAHILSRLRYLLQLKTSDYLYELNCLQGILDLWGGILNIIGQVQSAQDEHFDLHRENRIRTMLTFIHQNYTEPITINDIAASASISRSECYRCFSSFSNIAPMEYANRYRIQQAVKELINGKKNISDVCFANGFSNLSYFGKVFKDHYGLSPTEFRKREPVGIDDNRQ